MDDLTFSHTSTDRELVVTITSDVNDQSEITGVTLNGEPMTPDPDLPLVWTPSTGVEA